MNNINNIMKYYDANSVYQKNRSRRKHRQVMDQSSRCAAAAAAFGL